MDNSDNTPNLSERDLLIQQALALQELERRIQANPLKYHPQHLKQLEATYSDKPIRVLFWGNRVGKTQWGAMEVARYVQGYAHTSVKVMNSQKKVMPFSVPHKDIKLPIEIWCACPSYDQQKETTQKKLEQYIPKQLIKHISYVKSGVWGEVLLQDGTRINFKSYEQGREKFQGAGKRLIWFDEEPPKDIWDECFVRVEAGIPLDIIMTMTPVNGMTWVYDDLYLDTSNSDLFVSEAEWDDNPFLTEKQKDQMMRGLSLQAIEVRRKGKFMKKTGLVCNWFQRDTHIGDITFNEDWEVGAAIDFGFSNPCCFGLIGANYDDDLTLFDGFYETGLTTPHIAERIDKICAPYGINPKNMLIIGDSAQAESIQALNDMGYNVIGIKKRSGTSSQNWDEYRAEKMHQYGQVVNGKAKLKVSKNLMYYDEKTGNDYNWFAKEAGSLKWSEVASAVGKDKQQGDTWDPRFANHSIDMLSYYIIDHLEAPARPQAGKPWEGQLKGTYIEPSVPDDDANVWAVQNDDGNYNYGEDGW